MIEKTKKLLLTLRTQRKTVVYDLTYNSLKYYIKGYIEGVGHAYSIPLNMKITEWLEAKINTKLNMFWTDYIYYLADQDELKACDLLLDTLEQYIGQSDELDYQASFD